MFSSTCNHRRSTLKLLIASAALAQVVTCTGTPDSVDQLANLVRSDNNIDQVKELLKTEFSAPLVKEKEIVWNACTGKSLEILKLLTKDHRFNINDAGHGQGTSCLFMASETGNVGQVRFLLSSESGYNVADEDILKSVKIAREKKKDLVLLLSTSGVGGVGLNLIEFNCGVILDPDWNPQIDS